MSKLIVGCGYLGSRLAGYWSSQGEEVFATTRSPSRADSFRTQGWKPILLDVTQASGIALPSIETIVFAIGFDRSAEHSMHEVYVEGLRKFMTACPGSIRHFVYVSSTGVYGQTNGDWVDEESPSEPNRDGGRVCLAAERLLQADRSLRSKTTILRVAGIYGPDRLPRAESLRQGKPLQVAADEFLNLIHVDDLVRIIAACERKVRPPITMCVSDGHPVKRGDFYSHLAELMGTTRPVFATPAADSGRADRPKGSKRIRNDRLLAELKPEFLYPSFREGLVEIVG